MIRRRCLSAFLTATMLMTAAIAVAGEPRPAKTLIEFGWDEPDTRFLRDHRAEMERTPFDGCVFHVDGVAADGKGVSLTWAGWGRRTFTIDELKAARDDLAAIRPTTLKHHFLRFNTTPADVDWFDEFAPILANARLAASLAREGPCDGILFDIEQYEGHLFDFKARPDATTKGWDAYAAQARKRGAEVMEAFQSGFPDLTVLLTYGHTLPWVESGRGKAPLAETPYGLLAPFLDGMVAAARGKARLVDGYELSYGYRTADQFADGYAMMKDGVLPIVADREAYHRAVSAGFGIWLDYDWRKHGWDADDPSKNRVTPESFEASVRAALDRSDEYVWIYTETPPLVVPARRPGQAPRGLLRRPAPREGALIRSRRAPQADLADDRPRPRPAPIRRAASPSFHLSLLCSLASNPLKPPTPG